MLLRKPHIHYARMLVFHEANTKKYFYPQPLQLSDQAPHQTYELCMTNEDHSKIISENFQFQFIRKQHILLFDSWYLFDTLYQELIKSNRFAEAENWQRKILHNLELSKACRYVFLLLYYCFIICSGDSTAYANLVIVMMHALKNELELIYIFRY